MNYPYKQKSDEAFNLHKSGKTDEAEAIYRELIEINPSDANILNLYGLLCISKKRYDDAVALLTKAMLLKKDAYIMSNLGKAYYFSGDCENAVKIYRNALEYGDSDDIRYSLAIAYNSAGDVKNAEKEYFNAVKLNNKNINAYYNLCLLCSKLGKTDDVIKYAEECCRINDYPEDICSLLSETYALKGDKKAELFYLTKAAEKAPDKYVYFYNAAVLFAQKGNISAAMRNYETALKLNPLHIESLVNSGALYKKDKENEKALIRFQKAYEIAPDSELTVYSLAQLYKDTYKNDESIAVLKKFAKNHPDSAEAYSLLAMNYMDLCEYETALEYAEKAVGLSPDNPGFLHGKAIALKYCGKEREALDILEKIVAAGNADDQTKITLGMFYLQNKVLKRGSELYFLRKNDTEFKKKHAGKMLKFGDDVSEKTVLIYSDCGLGDTIMYSRFLPQFAKKCKSVILQTDKTLIGVLKQNFPGIPIISKTENEGEIDCAISIMELQYFLGIDFSEIRSPESYLEADSDLTEKYRREIFSESKKPKIGLFWQGNRKIFKNRSVNAGCIKELAANCNFDFYSFQIEEECGNIENIISLKPYIVDYSDTAALLKNLDLLITIDSSIAHMAGALGVKTFLILPYTAEWRWFFDTETTLWYKSIRIFKQTEIGNYREVIKRICKETKNMF